MDAKRARLRTMVIIVCISLSTFVLTWQDSGARNGSAPADNTSVTPGAAEDPTGSDPVMIASQSAATDQVGACQTFGGTATVIDQRATATIDVRCTGGILDGMVCQNGHYGSVCNYYRGPTSPEEDPNVTPTGGILIVPMEPGEELEDAAGTSTTPAVAEDPVGSDTMVIANQVGHPVDLATMQAAVCKIAGGKERIPSPSGRHVSGWNRMSDATADCWAE